MPARVLHCRDLESQYPTCLRTGRRPLLRRCLCRGDAPAPLFLARFTDIDVVLAVAQHLVDENGQPAGHAEDGDTPSLVASLATEGGTQSGLGVCQRDGCHAQDGGGASRPGAVGLLVVERLACGDGRCWRQAQPGHKVLLRGEGRQVEAGLSQQGQGSFGADAVDSRQIDSGKAPQFGAQVVRASAAMAPVRVGVLFWILVSRRTSTETSPVYAGLLGPKLTLGHGVPMFKYGRGQGPAAAPARRVSGRQRLLPASFSWIDLHLSSYRLILRPKSRRPRPETRNHLQS